MHYLGLSRLLKVVCNRPVELMNFSNGLNAAGLLNRNNKESSHQSKPGNCGEETISSGASNTLVAVYLRTV